MFQSPQWGSNSKDHDEFRKCSTQRFSPRNGEVILKILEKEFNYARTKVSVPAMGK